MSARCLLDRVNGVLDSILGFDFNLETYKILLITHLNELVIAIDLFQLKWTIGDRSIG